MTDSTKWHTKFFFFLLIFFLLHSSENLPNIKNKIEWICVLVHQKDRNKKEYRRQVLTKLTKWFLREFPSRSLERLQAFFSMMDLLKYMGDIASFHLSISNELLFLMVITDGGSFPFTPRACPYQIFIFFYIFNREELEQQRETTFSKWFQPC